MKKYFFQAIVLLILALGTISSTSASYYSMDGGALLILQDKNGNAAHIISLPNKYMNGQNNPIASVQISLIDDNGKLLISFETLQANIQLPYLNLPKGTNYMLLCEIEDFSAKSSGVW